MKLKNLEINLRAKTNPIKEKALKHIKSSYFKDTVTQFLLIPSVFLLLSGWVLSVYYFRANEYLVPLKYNSFMGVFSLGSWYDSYLITIVVTVCFLANIFLGKTFYEKDKFLGYILAASNIFLTIIAITIIVNFGKLLVN